MAMHILLPPRSEIEIAMLLSNKAMETLTKTKRSILILRLGTKATSSNKRLQQSFVFTSSIAYIYK